jgi:hypothetical protein
MPDNTPLGTDCPVSTILQNGCLITPGIGGYKRANRRIASKAISVIEAYGTVEAYQMLKDVDDQFWKVLHRDIQNRLEKSMSRLERKLKFDDFAGLKDLNSNEDDQEGMYELSATIITDGATAAFESALEAILKLKEIGTQAANDEMRDVLDEHRGILKPAVVDALEQAINEFSGESNLSFVSISSNDTEDEEVHGIIILGTANSSSVRQPAFTAILELEEQHSHKALEKLENILNDNSRYLNPRSVRLLTNVIARYRLELPETDAIVDDDEYATARP